MHYTLTYPYQNDFYSHKANETNPQHEVKPAILSQNYSTIYAKRQCDLGRQKQECA